MMKNHEFNDGESLEDLKNLQKVFGELNHVGGDSRPDISYVHNAIAR